MRVKKIYAVASITQLQSSIQTRAESNNKSTNKTEINN